VYSRYLNGQGNGQGRGPSSFRFRPSIKCCLVDASSLCAGAVCRFLIRGLSSARTTFVGRKTNDPLRRTSEVRSTSTPSSLFTYLLRWSRGQIDLLIQTVMASIASEWNAVNSTFADRVAEYVDARNKIQAHLAKVRYRLTWPRCVGVQTTQWVRSSSAKSIDLSHLT